MFPTVKKNQLDMLLHNVDLLLVIALFQISRDLSRQNVIIY